MSDNLPETPVEIVDTTATTSDTTSEKESKLKSAWLEFVSALNEEKVLPFLHETYEFMKSKLSKVDGELSEKHGDRYAKVKQTLQTLKIWYEEEMTKVKNGQTNPVDQTKTQWDKKAGEAGVSAAQKEAELKQRIIDLLPNK
ncbi:MAG: hypothetical protein N5P05_001647 [Chroococcopsis gigantea SAG 12.99]|jgi:hypothetical protein|nr:hypothetical protein [Chroococcopsis gigantea SAG 12.99]